MSGMRLSRRSCARKSARRSARVWEKFYLIPQNQLFPPQIVTGLALTEVDSPAQAEQPITRGQVVSELAMDLQYALSRKGRAPFILAGLPMFDDLCALRWTLAQCLVLEDDAYLRHWYTVLDSILPAYQAAFAEVKQALDWVDGMATILSSPLPTTEEKGEDGDTVALNLAHYLGHLADLQNLTPWMAQFRDGLLDVSERYWAIRG